MIPRDPDLISAIRRAILLTVTYADIFDYPLTADEIHRYLTGLHSTPEQVKAVLDKQAEVQQTGSYYTLSQRASILSQRQQREKKAKQLWRHAIRYGQRIAFIPFIRMVAVTGSLAMNNSDDIADIDYLIVTAPGRLWLCRAMVLALGRLAAMEGLNLCPNYLITTSSLHFTDHNLYVAHEITQMVPLSGMEVYQEIRAQNDWVRQYLPNADGVPPVAGTLHVTEPVSAFRKVMEAALQSPIASWFERWEMNRKIQKLELEQSGSPESYFSADYCKGHLNQHATHTNEAFNERLRALVQEGIS